jgi:hypothetical protein
MPAPQILSYMRDSATWAYHGGGRPSGGMALHLALARRVDPSLPVDPAYACTADPFLHARLRHLGITRCLTFPLFPHVPTLQLLHYNMRDREALRRTASRSP